MFLSAGAMHGLYKALMSLTLSWECPVFTTILYVLWVQSNNRKLDLQAAVTARGGPRGKKLRAPPARRAQKSFGLKAFIFAHNMVMCVFSLVVFYYTAPIVLRNFVARRFSDFILDPDGEMTKEIWVWTWAFYVSKYYEIVDTVILFKAKKPSSFLQMYHHAGAIIACWLLAMAKTHAAWVFVVLNSFIHTLMYFYYALTVLGIKPSFKRYVTLLQIGQFFLGNVFGFLFVLNREAYSKDVVVKRYQVAAFLVNFFYVLILIVLFLRFQRETYRKAPVASAEPKTRRRVREAEMAKTSALSQSPMSPPIRPAPAM